MTENIVDRTIKAREDLDKLQNLVDAGFSKLCQLCDWNPQKELAELQAISAKDKPDTTIDAEKEPDPTLPALEHKGEISECKDLVCVTIPEKVETAGKDADLCRVYAKKIAQLTHPDKLRRFDSKTTAKLIDIFHRSALEFKFLDLNALAFSYIHVRILRREEHKIEKELMHFAQAEFEQIVGTFNYILQQPFIPAINAWSGGNIPVARFEFQKFIDQWRTDHGIQRL